MTSTEVRNEATAQDLLEPPTTRGVGGKARGRRTAAMVEGGPLRPVSGRTSFG